MTIKKITFICASTLVSFLTACASTPDPAEVCTADWLEPRAERALDRIDKQTRSAIRPLQKAAKSYAKGEQPGLFTMMSLSSSFKSLEKELKAGRGVKDLKILAKTCNDPKIVSDLLLSFMQDKGLPNGMIQFFQSLPMYDELIQVDPGPAVRG